MQIKYAEMALYSAKFIVNQVIDMKKILVTVIFLVFSVTLIPYAVSQAALNEKYQKDDIKTALKTISSSGGSALLANEKAADKNEEEMSNVKTTYYNNKMIKVYVKEKDKIEEMKMYDYICGVVAGEMAANSPKEALKAQAAASYTYTIYKMEAAENNKDLFPEHKGADACTDINHCKAYLSPDEAKSKWGENWFDKYWGSIEQAVKEVDNKAILYDNKPINSVFHAISAGRTEDALAVWGSNVPYLKSADSSQDKSAPLFKSTQVISINSFKENMLSLKNDLVFDEEAGKWIGGIKRSSENSGIVETIEICGVQFCGSDLRELFKLRSCDFNIKYTAGSFIFEVYGYGHGVGMSQYGACQMAREGKTFEEILKHYYSNVAIQDYSV